MSMKWPENKYMKMFITPTIKHRPDHLPMNFYKCRFLPRVGSAFQKQCPKQWCVAFFLTGVYVKAPSNALFYLRPELYHYDIIQNSHSQLLSLPKWKTRGLRRGKKLDFASLKSFCNAPKETAVNSVGSSPSAGLRLWTGFCIQVRAVSLMLTVVAAVSSHAEHGPAQPSIRARLCASFKSKSLWSRTSNWSFVIVQTQWDVLGGLINHERDNWQRFSFSFWQHSDRPPSEFSGLLGREALLSFKGFSTNEMSSTIQVSLDKTRKQFLR